MRSALALAVLTCLFSVSARAELVEAGLSGHVTSIQVWSSGTGAVSAQTGVLGFVLGDTVQGTLRYDTTLPQMISLPTGPGGYGLSLTAGGNSFTPTDTFSIQAAPLAFSSGNSVFTFLERNNLVYQPAPSLVPIVGASFFAEDPQGKLSGASGSTLPTAAALAGYSPQGNATIGVDAFLDQSQMAHVDIAVDSISVASIAANQAPEPSSLALFILGSLGLFAARRRGRICDPELPLPPPPAT